MDGWMSPAGTPRRTVHNHVVVGRQEPAGLGCVWVCAVLCFSPHTLLLVLVRRGLSTLLVLVATCNNGYVAVPMPTCVLASTPPRYRTVCCMYIA